MTYIFHREGTKDLNPKLREKKNLFEHRRLSVGALF